MMTKEEFEKSSKELKQKRLQLSLKIAILDQKIAEARDALKEKQVRKKR